MKKNIFLLKQNEEEGESWGRKVIKKTIWGVITITLIKWLFPSLIPLGSFELWHIKGDLWTWLVSAKWMFAWAFGVSTIIFLIAGSHENERPGYLFKKGFLTSLEAGVVEEIIFRWLIFMSAMPGLYIMNWILGGFFGADWGLIQWFYVKVLGNIANFFTFGLMHDYIFNPLSWVIGASIITTNTLFRDGHAYQKLLGWINSWYCGMFLFFITLKYGLVAAIIIHFLYDLIIFSLKAFWEYIEQKREKKSDFYGRWK